MIDEYLRRTEARQGRNCTCTTQFGRRHDHAGLGRRHAVGRHMKQPDEVGGIETQSAYWSSPMPIKSVLAHLQPAARSSSRSKTKITAAEGSLASTWKATLCPRRCAAFPHGSGCSRARITGRRVYAVRSDLRDLARSNLGFCEKGTSRASMLMTLQTRSPSITAIAT